MRVRYLVPGLAVLVLLSIPLIAQDAPQEFSNSEHSVKVTAPTGWKRTLDESKPAGAWIDLVRYEEEKAGAKLTLSVQATTYRSSAQMVAALVKQFEGEASLAVLRKEVKDADARRPKWVLFEYTMRGRRGPEHAFAAYWLNMGRRYRIYGVVREAAWRTASADMERFIGTLAFTSRAFSKATQNYTDVTKNFAIYFPESWTVELPARGPRVVFASGKLGTAVWVYVTAVQNDLAAETNRLAAKLEEGDAKITDRSGVANHPTLGLEFTGLEYSRGTGDSSGKYREAIFLHREKLYRIVLAARPQTFPTSLETFDRVVGSLKFLK